MTPADQDLLKYITETIVERFRPERIVLFGSRARGEEDAESDFDLFVEMSSELRPPERASLVSAAFGLRPWSLDVIVLYSARGREIAPGVRVPDAPHRS